MATLRTSMRYCADVSLTAAYTPTLAGAITTTMASTFAANPPKACSLSEFSENHSMRKSLDDALNAEKKVTKATVGTMTARALRRHAVLSMRMRQRQTTKAAYK